MVGRTCGRRRSLLWVKGRFAPAGDPGRAGRCCSASGPLRAPSSFAPLAKADAIIINVPTPLEKGGPRPVECCLCGRRPGKAVNLRCLFVLESTTYPGTNRGCYNHCSRLGSQGGGRTSSSLSRPNVSIRVTASTISQISRKIAAIDTASREPPKLGGVPP